MSKPSQDDILAENQRLTGELTTARTDITRLTGERDDHAAKITSLTAERDGLKGEVTQLKANLSTVTGERDKLAGESRDFEKRVASELVKHGIRPQGVETPQGAGTSDLVAQYQAITDPKARAEFLAKHEKEIRALVAKG